MKTLLLTLILTASTFAATFTAPEMKAEGKTAIAITGDNVAGAVAFQFHLTLPEGVHLVYSNGHYHCSTPLAFSIVCNEVNGEAYVAAYGVYPIDEDGVIANLLVNGQGVADLSFSEAYLFDNGGPMELETRNGWLLLY